MRIQAIVLSLVLSLFSAAAIAGAGHSHDPVSQSQAEEIAASSVSQLVDRGKLDQSWKTTGVAKVEKKNFGGSMEWVVTFIERLIIDATLPFDLIGG